MRAIFNMGGGRANKTGGVGSLKVDGSNLVQNTREPGNSTSDRRRTGQRAGETISQAGLEKSEVKENKFDAEKMMQKELKRSDVEKLIEELDELDKFVDKGFDFHIHEGTENIWVEVIDRASDEIVREIPSEKLLDIVAGLKELVGLFLDEKI